VRGLSLFNLVFLSGLLLSVRVMVVGVERCTREGQSVVRSRWAMLAGTLTLAGFTGSVLNRSGAASISLWSVVLIAAMAGGWSARLLVRRAAAMPVSDHEFDPRFELQGVPATVVSPIPAGGDGLVRLTADGGAIAARSFDGSPIASGIEVGVERIENGVAIVESWAAIETRL